MNRPFNWSAMPDAVNGSVPVYQQEEVAALMRDLGILNRADFGTDATGAAFYYWDFARAFGYAPISMMYSSDPDFFTTITSEIDELRPVLLAIPGHMTVADGYASDGAGRNVHVNMGWGGAYDDYYYLDQTIVAGGYSFAPDHRIYYNIRPCEGAECNPYSPAGGGQPPVIDTDLPDMILDSATTLRIEAFDPDGDTVTLTATTTCSGLNAELNANLLTLTPTASDIFCEVSVRAQSIDGETSKSFMVLCLDEKIYLGTQYDIGGQFASQYEVDTYQAYLDGSVTVSGTRGYIDQAFFIWISDDGGSTVIGPDNAPVSGSLAPGIYTISASLASGGTYYPYNENMSVYILSVSNSNLTYTVSDLAADLGIGLTTGQPQQAMPWIPLLLLGD
jgi:hypothetical protein